jgi:thiosulfate/3-mercaptopyruvate sulfurtransferase
LKLRYLLTVSAICVGLLSAGARAAPVYVDTQWLAERLDDPGVVLMDVSDDTQYMRFHIPGSVHLPYSALVKQDKKKKIPVRLDDRELYKRLGHFGIKRDRHVVLYDDMGGLNAGRLFWELERIGHPKVSVLDGGLVTWILEGHKVTNKPVKPRAAVYQAHEIRRANEADLEEIVQAVKSRSSVLLDVRTEEEYVGHPKQARSGHIPSARWWPWDQSVDFERGFVRRNEQAIVKSLAQVGVKDKQAPIITYCRSGHRAAQSYLILRSLGYENVKLFANSMNEYAAAKTAPLKRGKQP